MEGAIAKLSHPAVKGACSFGENDDGALLLKVPLSFNQGLRAATRVLSVNSNVP